MTRLRDDDDFTPRDDEFIMLVKSSQFKERLKKAVIDVITQAIDSKKRKSPKTPASVLLGMTGFYVFNNDQKSFLTVRQKVLSYDGTKLTYGNVKMLEKFPYTTEVFKLCEDTSEALYVELVPQTSEDVHCSSGKKIASVCPQFTSAVISNASVVRSTKKRNVFHYLDSADIFCEIEKGNEDADGFGVTKIMLCAFLKSTMNKTSRMIELNLGSNVFAKYINFMKNAEVPEAGIANEKMLVFVNPTLAPNSKPGTTVTLFTSGYSGIYGKESKIYSVIPQVVFDNFEATNASEMQENPLDLTNAMFSF